MTGDRPGATATPALPVWRDPAAWSRTADFVALLVAVSLPWSTSLVSIFVGVWILVVAPSIDIRTFIQLLRRPICALPIALFVLAIVGTLWSPAPWHTRLYYIGPTSKLMILPLLIYHFERSNAGLRVVLAFLASCSMLLLISWASYIDPPFVLDIARAVGIRVKDYVIGLPVKNYITQSQEFVICAFGCAIAAAAMWHDGRRALSAGFAVLGAVFIINPFFVISSRTALVCVPALTIVFAVKYLSRRASALVLAGMVVTLAAAWMSSSYLRTRLEVAVTDYMQYKKSNDINSSGERLEFWRKSLKFLRTAPLIGHGTGSVRGLFERDAVGQTRVSAEVISNPHNQTLYFAIQWGFIGIVLLFAMWTVHFFLFRGIGWGPWLGTLVVVQNFVGSIFNSHLSDFVEGWIYVMGVGIAGGMVLNVRTQGGVYTGNKTKLNYLVSE